MFKISSTQDKYNPSLPELSVYQEYEQQVNMQY